MDECKQVVKEIATPDKDDADYSSVTTTTKNGVSCSTEEAVRVLMDIK